MTPEENEIVGTRGDATIPDIKNSIEVQGKEMAPNEKLLTDVSNILNIPNEIEGKIKLIRNADFDVIKTKITVLENDLSVLQGNLMALEQNLSKGGISNIKQTLSSLQNAVNANQFEIYGKTNELSKVIQQMQEKIASLEIYRNFENQMSEVIGRLVFLESRVIAVENMIRDIPKYSPIVVE